jgi:TPR repeat protein
MVFGRFIKGFNNDHPGVLLMKINKMTQFPWVLAAYFLGLGFWFISVPAVMAQNESPVQLTQKGWSYWNGTGVEKDYAKAVEYFQKAADQGDSGGEYGLGCAYDYGLGLGKDYSQAVKWYRKSSDQGNSYGQFGLGNCYELGKGVSRDLEKAKNLYELSAKQNNDQGEKAYGN